MPSVTRFAFFDGIHSSIYLHEYKFIFCICQLFYVRWKKKKTWTWTWTLIWGHYMGTSTEVTDWAYLKVKVPVYWPPSKVHCGICAHGLYFQSHIFLSGMNLNYFSQIFSNNIWKCSEKLWACFKFQTTGNTAYSHKGTLLLIHKWYGLSLLCNLMLVKH